MFGLCMPTGETFLLMKDGREEIIMMSDENNPRKHIMTSKHVLDSVKHRGYKNIDAIGYVSDYKHSSKRVMVSMADYYAEHGKELEDK